MSAANPEQGDDQTTTDNNALQRPALGAINPESLTLQARAALQAKLAGFASSKPTQGHSALTIQATQVVATTLPSGTTPAATKAGSTVNAGSITASLLASSSKSTSAEHSYAAQPMVNGTRSSAKEKKTKAPEESQESSDSSSSASSSESSSSSDGESDGEEKKAKSGTANTSQVTPTPTRRGRGRPRKYPTTTTPSSEATPTASTTTKGKSPKRTPKAPQQTKAGSVSEDKKRLRGRGCGNCPGCLREDCGKCPYCADKPKFGGPGRKKQRCSLRVCSNFTPVASKKVASPGVRSSKYSPHHMATAAAKKATPTAKAEPIAKALPPAPPTIKDTPTTIVTVLSSDTSSVVSATASAMATTSTTPSTTTAMTTTTTTKTPKKGEPVEKEAKITCIHCGRERKKSMARSDKFCTQRCILQWLEVNPDKTLQDAIADDAAPPVATAALSLPPAVPKKKSFPRELKNLQIDMALPGTTLPQSITSPDSSPPPTTNPISPPTLAPSPKPVTSTTVITTKRQAATQPTPTAAKKAKETPTGPAATAGVKRGAAAQPQATKKSKPEVTTPTVTPVTSSSKSVSFDLNMTTIPLTSIQPISAPPLSRTIPPPSISIVPLDQLTALGTALLNQQKQRRIQQEDTSKLPPGVPTDVRLWSIEQVVRYFENTADCADYADLFREQEVDGTALLLLTHESLVKCLGIKLGRALKIMVHVEDLRKIYESQVQY